MKDNQILEIYEKAFLAGQSHSKPSSEIYEIIKAIAELNKNQIQNSQDKDEIFLRELRKIRTTNKWILIMLIPICSIMFLFLFLLVIGTILDN